MAEVLVVDDDRDIRDLVSFALTRNGFSVVTAVDGAAALEVIEGRPTGSSLPAVVLLDVSMPGLSGLEVCRELRQRPATREIPIVLLTARTGSDDRTQAEAAGATCYLAKPFDLAVLTAVVNTLAGEEVPQTSS